MRREGCFALSERTGMFPLVTSRNLREGKDPGCICYLDDKAFDSQITICKGAHVSRDMCTAYIQRPFGSMRPQELILISTMLNLINMFLVRASFATRDLIPW